MISAVVLVTTNHGQESNVLEELRNLAEVEEAHQLWGVYDFMVKVKANSIDRLKEIVRVYLRQLAGVSSVLTLMIIKSSATASTVCR